MQSFLRGDGSDSASHSHDQTSFRFTLLLAFASLQLSQASRHLDLLRCRDMFSSTEGPMTITSLDFETANYSRVSICAAGMAVFEDGKLTEAPYWLVRPPKGHGWFHEGFIECHG